ncbi:MAG: glycosyltransferase family 4 protein [Planctomycetota bacterium]|jgi:glycosyltransferase involved in cell wall biosynthesis
MSDHLNILSIISSNLHSGPGVPALLHLQLLQKSGHNVRLICLPGKNLSAKAAEKGVETGTELNLPRNGKFWQIFPDCGKLKTIINDFRPDLIFVHKTIETILCGLAVSKKQIPVIRVWHDGSGRRISRADRILHNFTGIPVIATTTSGIKATRLFSPRRVEPIPYLQGAVDTDIFSPDNNSSFLKNKFALPENSVIAGAVSRLKPDRKLELFLEAFSRTADKAANLYGIIIGKGEEAEKLSSYADKLNIRKRIFILSPEEHFIEAVSGIDFLIALRPGSDGTARTVLEAMACGKPALLMEEGSLADFSEDLNNRCGAVCKDTEELSAEILKLASDKILREKYGNNAAKSVKEKYSNDILKQKINKLCLTAVSEKWHL